MLFSATAHGRTILLMLFCTGLLSRLSAQDPFATHFLGNEALFNPALTAQRGATSITLKTKQQWLGNDLNGYRNYQALYEESLPCAVLDYGLVVLQNTEGAGLLQTQQLGGMIAANFTLREYLDGSFLQLNLGAGSRWARQSIDYDRLRFIDQLDPKYGLTGPNGLPITSSFVAPNDGTSRSYLLPSGGFRLRYARSKNRRALEFQLGGAYHNAVALGRGGADSWSVLGTNAPAVARYNGYATGELLLKGNRQYYSVRPGFFYQKQGALDYFEAGIDGSLSRLVTVGMAYHHGGAMAEVPGTNWLSYRLEAAFFTGTDTRMDLGFAYAHNVSGLRNQVNGTIEVTARFSFNWSVLCGRPVINDYGRHAIPCDVRQGNKHWENIWYRQDYN